jgi:sugar phosphate isomerase/epimerase
MNRREFLAVAGGAAVGAWALAAGPIPADEAKGQGIRFGFCGDPAQGAVYKEAGCDYVEGGVQSFLKPMDETWVPAVARDALALPLESYNTFLPATLKITGPDVDLEKLKAYATRACERAKAMGSSVIVWGSGPARKIPDGWPRDKAEEQYVAALRVAGPIAKRNGLVLALEPLPSSETNIANTTIETFGHIRKAGAEGIALMVDLRHFTTMKEPLENLDTLKGQFVHAHVGNPQSDPAVLRSQMVRLKAGGFCARMSIEGGVKDVKKELKPAIEMLRKIWAEA